MLDVAYSSSGESIVVADSEVLSTKKLSNSMLLFVLEYWYMLLVHHVELSVSILKAVWFQDVLSPFYTVGAREKSTFLFLAPDTRVLFVYLLQHYQWRLPKTACLWYTVTGLTPTHL